MENNVLHFFRTKTKDKVKPDFVDPPVGGEDKRQS
jgi:hypothetical protein